MHQSSLENMQACYEKFIKQNDWPGRDRIKVIDIGGSNVNGTYADIFSGEEFDYAAVDITPDDTVDIVLDDPYILPFENNSLDIIISGQAFEHVEFFWLLFEEMIRVLKPDGILILIAPSAGPIHQYPVDCYRFYPDAYRALAKYCDCDLLYLKHDPRGPWRDLVGVFAKSALSFTDSMGNNWQTNRFESATQPAALIFEKNPETDIIRGQTPYLEILESLHHRKQPGLYLEIGLRNGNSFQYAQCQSIGIDPAPDIKVGLSSNHQIYRMTSDLFFEEEATSALAGNKIDMAFIDGMHLFEFALRDFMNIEAHSKPGSMIIIDDIYPNHPKQAERQRQSVVWTGDVWKLALCLEQERPDLKLTYLDTSPTGLLLITNLSPENHRLTERYNPLIRKYRDMELKGLNAEKFLHRKDAIDPAVWQNYDEDTSI